jgi:hypothetical protein
MIRSQEFVIRNSLIYKNKPGKKNKYLPAKNNRMLRLMK